MPTQKQTAVSVPECPSGLDSREENTGNPIFDFSLETPIIFRAARRKTLNTPSLLPRCPMKTPTPPPPFCHFWPQSGQIPKWSNSEQIKFPMWVKSKVANVPDGTGSFPQLTVFSRNSKVVELPLRSAPTVLLPRCRPALAGTRGGPTRARWHARGLGPLWHATPSRSPGPTSSSGSTLRGVPSLAPSTRWRWRVRAVTSCTPSGHRRCGGPRCRPWRSARDDSPLPDSRCGRCTEEQSSLPAFRG